jgi:S-adenosylmethionine-diacylglycerol 3-amino-3-carboxypropyl transferase
VYHRAVSEQRERVKFAVVREDPELEAALFERAGARAALVVASGGCTALTLAARYGDLAVTAFDVSPAQLDHVREKARAVAAGAWGALNVGDADPAGLNQRGWFEGLFRCLRGFVEELVAPRVEIEELFTAASPARAAALVEAWTASAYWPAAFASSFNDALLHAMFGPAATQHAAPGSYPGYFRRVFERGLRRADAPRNPFLQHVLLGRYLERDAPEYVRAGRLLAPALVLGSLPDVPDLARFDVYSLSNVFDWSDDGTVARWAGALAAAARPGSAVLVRKLNNDRDVRRFFEPAFRFDDALGASLLERDRSLFYDRIEVAFRT